MKHILSIKTIMLYMICICSGCIFIGCSTTGLQDSEGTEYPGSVTFNALVISKDANSLSVIVMDDDKNFQRFDPVHVGYDTTKLDVSKDISKEISLGDLVEITFNGMMAESYPCQIGANKIKVKEKASDNWPATSSIPSDYSVEAAVKDNCFVMSFDKVESKDLLDNFISNSENGIIGFLRKVSYTVEGDPIITDVIFDGKKYYVFEDDTRDKFAGNDLSIYKNEFQYVNSYEKDGYKLLYLAEKKDITAEDYEKSLFSSDSKDYLETYPLYQETKSTDNSETENNSNQDTDSETTENINTNSKNSLFKNLVPEEEGESCNH